MTEEWRPINPFEPEEKGLSPEDKAQLHKATKWLLLISIFSFIIVTMVTIPYA